MIEKELKAAIEDVVSMYLEDYSVENLLEELDVTPEEVIVLAFSAGLIDEDNLNNLGG
jgi:hypothetical protein